MYYVASIKLLYIYCSLNSSSLFIHLLIFPQLLIKMSRTNFLFSKKFIPVTSLLRWMFFNFKMMMMKCSMLLSKLQVLNL